MKVDIKTGRLKGVAFLPSPFFNDRSERVTISLAVIHNISLPPGQFGGPYIDQLFTDQLDNKTSPYSFVQMRVAPHVLIDRQGVVKQYVSFNDRAWHAGISVFRGQEECNDFAIGIELEGSDDVPFEPAQYERLVELLQTLMAAYPAITQDRIVGHADIAAGRKTDPGPRFDWVLLREKLKS